MHGVSNTQFNKSLWTAIDEMHHHHHHQELYSGWHAILRWAEIYVLADVTLTGQMEGAKCFKSAAPWWAGAVEISMASIILLTKYAPNKNPN
jgi:hypothetical protein